jgi:ferredoxin--NADP+ reductase
LFKIVKKQKIIDGIFLFKISAPAIAAKFRPGQFVILQLDDDSGRIPVNVVDADKRTITVIPTVKGPDIEAIFKLRKGKMIAHITGPLGNPLEVKEYGTVCLIAEDFGIASLYLLAKAMKAAGNRVIVIVGAADKKHMYWHDRLAKFSSKLILKTEDGSLGAKGDVSGALTFLMRKTGPDLVVAVGPIDLMKKVSHITHMAKLKTRVFLNTLMFDGIGLCGGCRVKIDGETLFTCVDGPHFDAHKIDWDEYVCRQNGKLIERCSH